MLVDYDNLSSVYCNGSGIQHDALFFNNFSYPCR